MKTSSLIILFSICTIINLSASNQPFDDSKPDCSTVICLENLPTDILTLELASHLDFRSIVCLAQTNKSMHKEYSPYLAIKKNNLIAEAMAEHKGITTKMTKKEIETIFNVCYTQPERIYKRLEYLYSQAPCVTASELSALAIIKREEMIYAGYVFDGLKPNFAKTNRKKLLRYICKPINENIESMYNFIIQFQRIFYLILNRVILRHDNEQLYTFIPENIAMNQTWLLDRLYKQKLNNSRMTFSTN